MGLPGYFLHIMSYILILLFGLCVGSFLNVVICRLKTKESIFIGRSHCPQCRTVLKWHDLIPVLSFLIQKGKCRYCNKKISWQYPLVEISTALLFLFVILNQQVKNLIDPSLTLRMTFYLIIISFLIIIFVYDLKHYIIPDKIIYPAIIVAGIFNFKFSILSALGASLFFLSLVLVSKGKWMGLGDVKLAFLMGLILGWPNILLALFLSFFSGAIVGVGLIILHKKGLKSEIPFGPFLSASTIFALLYGSQIIEKFLTIDNVF